MLIIEDLTYEELQKLKVLVGGTRMKTGWDKVIPWILFGMLIGFSIGFTLQVVMQ